MSSMPSARSSAKPAAPGAPLPPPRRCALASPISPTAAVTSPTSSPPSTIPPVPGATGSSSSKPPPNSASSSCNSISTSLSRTSAWPHPAATCYKRDWHLESLSFFLNFGWRAGTHRESLLPSRSASFPACRHGFGADHGTNGRYRTDRSGSHGPEPDYEYERPRIHGGRVQPDDLQGR